MARWKLNLLLTILLICFMNGMTESYRILVAPGVSSGSTVFYMEKIGRILAERGHQVTMLINDAVYVRSGHAVQPVHAFETFSFIGDWRVVHEDKANRTLSGTATWSDWLNSWLTYVPECDHVLNDKVLLKRLENANFDLIISNVFVICPLLLAHRLSRPFVLVGNNRINPMMDGSLYNIPSNPSYVPSMAVGLTSQMSFMERLRNVGHYTFTYIGFNYFMLPHYRNLQLKHNIRTDLTLHKMAETAELFFYNTDFAFDYPRPLLPNVILIGGIMAGPAAPLDKELEEFMQSSGEHGVVIFSLGSYVHLGKTDAQNIILSALGRLPQKVIFKYTDEIPDNVPSNIKALNWIPQNDLLGHPKTRAIVYHGGLNGVFEAVYHAVPIVGIPLYNDQWDNIPWLTKKGMAVTLDVRTLTQDKLIDAIQKVVTDESYKENAERLSRIHKDKPMSPADTLVFWIEHVIKHGGQHLRTQAGNLNVIQYYLIDVILFLGLIILLCIFFLKMLCSCLYKTYRNYMVGNKYKSD